MYTFLVDVHTFCWCTNFLLWVLCQFTRFAQLVWGRSRCSHSFLIQSEFVFLHLPFFFYFQTSNAHIRCTQSVSIADFPVCWRCRMFSRSFTGIAAEGCLLRWTRWYVWHDSLMCAHNSLTWRIHLCNVLSLGLLSPQLNFCLKRQLCCHFAATHCDTLQRIATHCIWYETFTRYFLFTTTHCHTLQHTTTHCMWHILKPTKVVGWFFFWKIPPA